VRSSSKYLGSLLGAATPVDAGSAGTLRPPRRIFDAVPEPEIASASRLQPTPEPPEAGAVSVRSAPVGEPGTGRSAPSVLATPRAEPDGLWSSPPVPSAKAAGIKSHGLFSPRSIHAAPAAGQGLPDLVPAVSHIADPGPVVASGDDLVPWAQAVPRSPGAPAGAALHPVADWPPAAPSALDPPKRLSDGPPPQFAAGPDPGSRHLAATGEESGVTIGTIEVTVAPSPAPPAVPQTPSPAPAPVGPAAPGRQGAMEAARMGSRRWFGAGQG
jgi:hypothetical protein